MKNQTIRDDGDVECQSLGNPVPDIHRALGVITGKWKGEILWQLVQRTYRFGELRRAIPGVTQHMLTAQLRELEADGLLKRTVYAEVPPRVEYELTPAAEALRPVFDELFRWWREHGAVAREQAPSQRP
ncbi:helix-turn-helix domain-containing protein [Terrarubrum flagellatum]|uniref:winged helix-turn-helix transcriptional regulator n=1 Tax=Terrirubrum flagellatum TaxID=2895980 RepID=UPI003145681F